MNHYFVLFLFLLISSNPIGAEDFEIDLKDQGCGGFKKLKNKDFLPAKNNLAYKKPTEEQKKLIANLIQKEPTFTQVQREVYRFFAIPTGQEFNNLRKRMRNRNLLPIISSNSGFNHDLGKVRNNDNNYSTSITRPNAGSSLAGAGLNNATYNNNDLNQSSGNNFSTARRNYWDTGLKIEFNLPNTVYDDEETDLFSEIRRFAPIRQDLGEQAQAAYFERRKRKINFILNSTIDEAEKLMQDLEIEEYTAKLDSLTGGWFSRSLREKMRD